MAATSFYDVCVGSYIRMLHRTAEILTVGQKFVEEKGIPESQLLATRLVEDMYSLPFQVQRVSDAAKLTSARVGAIADPPKFDDDETTLEQLQERIQKTLTWLESLPRDAFDGHEDREVSYPAVSTPFKAIDYVLQVGLPNAYFHVTMTYALLRHQGAPVGKRDFLGRTALNWKN